MKAFLQNDLLDFPLPTGTLRTFQIVWHVAPTKRSRLSSKGKAMASNLNLRAMASNLQAKASTQEQWPPT